MKTKLLICALASAAAFSAQAVASVGVSSINLGGYAVSGIYALDEFNGAGGIVSGLEASAVTYARDRGTLFYVGDEGTGVVEISLTGQTLGSMSFDWTDTTSEKHDTEGLTYLGNGRLVVTEERLFDAYSFSYVAGGSVSLAGNSVSVSNDDDGNDGLEGISYDARDGGSFVTVKQQKPQNILAGTLSFGASLTGASTMSTLFDANLMGLITLSDVQTLSSVDSFAGTSAADHLLVLSLESHKLVEVDRTGQVISSFDLTNVLANQGIEGVTVDEKGIIYLVAEQLQENVPAGFDPQSHLIVLTPVPEPETFAMLLAGLGLLGFSARRKKQI